jgi:Mis6
MFMCCSTLHEIHTSIFCSTDITGISELVHERQLIESKSVSVTASTSDAVHAIIQTLHRHTAVLETFGSTHGLSPYYVLQYVDIVSLMIRSRVDSQSIRQVLWHCLPITDVPAHAVVSLMGTFSNASRSVQILILRWIILVHYSVTPQQHLHSLYGVFFHFLEYETLRPHICHILFRLTRRHDVKPFRIRKLDSIVRRFGSENWTVGLQVVYQGFCSSAFPGVSLNASNVRYFRRLPSDWVEALHRVRSNAAATAAGDGGDDGDGGGAGSGDGGGRATAAGAGAAGERKSDINLPFALDIQRQEHSSGLKTTVSKSTKRYVLFVYPCFLLFDHPHHCADHALSLSLSLELSLSLSLS